MRAGIYRVGGSGSLYVGELVGEDTATNIFLNTYFVGGRPLGRWAPGAGLLGTSRLLFVDKSDGEVMDTRNSP